MRARALTTATLAASALLLAGCGSPGSTVTATTKSGPATTGASTMSAAAAMSAAASPTPTLPRIGTTQTQSSDGVTDTIQVTGYQVITLTGENQEGMPAGSRIGLVSVKHCLTANTSGDAIGFTWAAWSVLDASSHSADALSAYGDRDFPGPLYPNDVDKAVPTGQCRAGMIPFSLKGMGPVTDVEYSVDGKTADWAIG